MNKTCLTCLSLQGKQPLSPGPTIYDSQYWRVEHAYPVMLAGWLVIILKRHAEALHDVIPSEFHELVPILQQSIDALHKTTKCQKEYVRLYTERSGFHHVHFQVIAKPHDLPKAYLGPNISQLMKARNTIPKTKVIKLSQELQKCMA